MKANKSKKFILLNKTKFKKDANRPAVGNN
jgi:hypothetical protein